MAVTRPVFGDRLELRESRHPIRTIMDTSEFIPNDVYASLESNFELITGPNMSGKSTYLRQIALLTVMAHIGCLIPATVAEFRVTDCLFTRLSNDDSIESNASSFMIEMRDMAYILHHLSPSSLVIVDELGRGTSVHDGMAITCAIAETLIQSRAYTFFATHYLELADILSVYPSVVNLNLRVEVSLFL
jgi:DNA mismatch repair protein MSH4